MLEIRGLAKGFRFRDTHVTALGGVDLDIGEGEFFVLLGPSGCGKTTMLRSIAGLERPDSGSIRIDDMVVFSGDDRRFVAPEHRPIGMVFQSYAVWPHMSVHENVAFPLREGVRRLGAALVRERVAEVLDLLALGEMADRPVTTLSGGQQQRVALARALALQPKVLLMDEPLSNLDFKLQVRLRAQLKDLLRRLRMTTVYVTHNQAEAMDTGDRIAVMDHGQLVQLGTPREIYQRPVDEFVARFIGEMSLVPARLTEINNGFAQLESEIGVMRTLSPASAALRAGSSCFLGLRPEDLEIRKNGAAAENGIENGFTARVTARQFVGEAMIYTVAAGSQAIRVKAHHSLEIEEGSEVSVHIPPEHCTAVAPSRDGGDAYAGEEDLVGEGAADAL